MRNIRTRKNKINCRIRETVNDCLGTGMRLQKRVYKLLRVINDVHNATTVSHENMSTLQVDKVCRKFGKKYKGNDKYAIKYNHESFIYLM